MSAFAIRWTRAPCIFGSLNSQPLYLRLAKAAAPAGKPAAAPGKPAAKPAAKSAAKSGGGKAKDSHAGQWA